MTYNNTNGKDAPPRILAGLAETDEKAHWTWPDRS